MWFLPHFFYFMAKTKQQKEQSITSITEGMKSAKAVVIANFQGLKVSEMEELRAKCRENNITCVASKKTFVKKALADVGMDIDTKQFDGAPAVFIGLEDEVAPAQIVANFAKDHKMMTIFGGILEGQFISEAKVTELSKLPSKQQLLGQLVGTLNAPISGFVNVLAGNLRGLVTVLSAIKEQKA
jgi:large subunit ribosomal protein L10